MSVKNKPKKFLFARKHDTYEAWHIQYTIDDDGGNEIIHSHIFPLETLDWRAAEYEIDPTDSHTLLHIVMMEPLEDVQVSGEEHYLWNLPVAQARAEKLKRVELETRPDDPSQPKKISKANRQFTDDPVLAPIINAGCAYPGEIKNKEKFVRDAKEQHARDMRSKKASKPEPTKLNFGQP